jgi:hypothetical protein
VAKDPKYLDDFKEWVEHWLDAFSLARWEVIVRAGCSSQDNQAECSVDHLSKMAQITVSSNLDDTSPQNLKEVARHEVLELLLSKLSSYAEFGIAPHLVQEEVHNIIHSIESVMEVVCNDD